MKKVGLVVGILLLLVLLAAVLAPFLIDLNEHKAAILSQIQPYVPRAVDFDHVDLKVLTGLGVEVRGLRVADNPAFSDGDFLRLEGLQVRVRVLPLLKGQIKVKRVILKRPVVRVSRNGAGEFSFSDLKSSGQQRGQASPQTPVPEEAGGAPGVLAGLLVSEFAIRQGQVVYQDALLWPGEAPLVVDALDVDVKDFSLGRPISIQVAANLMGGPDQNFDLAGTVGPVQEESRPEDVPFSIRTSLRTIPLQSLLRLLPQKIPVEVRSGTLSLRWEASGSLGQKIVSKSEADLLDIRFAGAGNEPGGLETSGLRCQVANEVVLEYPAERLLVESMEVSVNGEGLRMQGAIEDFLKVPRWDVKIWSEAFRPDPLVSILPVLVQGMPEHLKVEGPLGFDLKSTGTQEDFLVEARLDLGGMQVQVQDLLRKPAAMPFSIGCKVDKKGDRVTLHDVELILHSLKLNASGEVALAETPHFGLLVQTSPVALEGWDVLCPMLSAYHPEGSFLLRSSLRGTPDDASVNLQASSERIGFHIPPSEGAHGSGASGSGLLESCNVKIQAKRRSTELTGLAQAEIRKGEVFAVPFEKLLSTAQYTQDLLEITGLELNVFQGYVQGTGRYDFAKGTWDFSPRAKDVAMGEALDRLTEYKNMFSGTFRGEFSAAGNAADGGKEAMNAAGSFRVSQGELRNFDLVGSVLDTLFGLKGVDRKLDSSGRKEIREQEATRFEWIEGAFAMKQGILDLKGLQLHNVGTSKATDSDALLDGSVVLESQGLDLRGKVILSKGHSDELAKQAEVLRALYNPEQRIVLPLTVQGNAQRPVAFLDTEYVLGAISRYYARQGVGKLREELGLPEGGKDGEEKPAEQLLRDLLRKQ